MCQEGRAEMARLGKSRTNLTIPSMLMEGRANGPMVTAQILLVMLSHCKDRAPTWCQRMSEHCGWAPSSTSD